MEVKGNFSIDCGRCGKSYNFSDEEVDFLKSQQKNGDNDVYVWEKHYNCTKCGNGISIRYEIVISSAGEVKDKKVDVSGAVKVEDTFEFKF